jgi:hypothetical protein
MIELIKENPELEIKFLISDEVFIDPIFNRSLGHASFAEKGIYYEYGDCWYNTKDAVIEKIEDNEYLDYAKDKIKIDKIIKSLNPKEVIYVWIDL